MQFITVIALLISLVVAAPSLRRDDEDLICFYMTVDPDWQGEGTNLCQAHNVCSDKLPNGLAGKVSSAGPDPGSVCFLYDDINCGGQSSEWIRYPGYANLEAIDFNDRAQSWKCDYAPFG